MPPEIRPDDAGSDVTVQIRDTSRADIAHPVIAEAHAPFPDGVPPYFDVELDTEDGEPRHPGYSAWVHCDHTGDGAIGDGDLITTQMFSVPLDSEQPIVVTLTRV